MKSIARCRTFVRVVTVWKECYHTVHLYYNRMTFYCEIRDSPVSPTSVMVGVVFNRDVIRNLGSGFLKIPVNHHNY